LDLRRDFKRNLDQASIASTSILNGAFLDLLLGQFPAFDLKTRTVTYWEDPDCKSGERISARELAAVAQDVSGKRFELVGAGSITELSDAIAWLKLASKPDDAEIYPDWQLMMYMRTMFSGSAEVGPLDNQRYPNLRWTSAREILEARLAVLAR
jgi:hypothetical protein